MVYGGRKKEEHIYSSFDIIRLSLVSEIYIFMTLIYDMRLLTDDTSASTNTTLSLMIPRFLSFSFFYYL